MAEIKTYVCPNCGANTTNTQNCEFCGSILVRFVEKGIDLSETSYLNDSITSEKIAEELKVNLQLQEENPNENVSTDLFAMMEDGSTSSMSIVRTGSCVWKDGKTVELGNGADGLIIVIRFDRCIDSKRYGDYNQKIDEQLDRFKQLHSFELFTSHTCNYIDRFAIKRYGREYAIDFGQDAEGAARLIFEILQEVEGWTIETCFDMFTNVGDNIDKARYQWDKAHGFQSISKKYYDNSNVEPSDSSDSSSSCLMQLLYFLVGLVIFIIYAYIKGSK